MKYWILVALSAMVILVCIGSILMISAFVLFLGFFHHITPALVSPLKRPLQTMVYESHSLTPVISNQWYSSLYTSFPSQPLYSLPLAYKITQEGLAFSYPEVTKTKNTIFAPFVEDFTVGIGKTLSKPKISNVGDWSIGIIQNASQNDSLSYVIGHGIPYTVIHATAGHITILFKRDVKIISRNSKSFIAAIQNHTYFFDLPQSAQVELKNNQIKLTGMNKISISLLDDLKHADLFEQSAFTEITNTTATPVINGNTLSITYTIHTDNGTPLIALYPHQYRSLSGNLRIGSYTTLRGELQLFQTNSFTTTIPLITPQDMFPPLQQNYPDLIDQIKQDIAATMQSGPPKSADYFLGTWFGKADTLLQLADTFHLDKEKNALLTYVTPIFLTSLSQFDYDSGKTALIAKHPEFGNEKLNDHHFHYGYYIRTAAVLSKFDPAVIEKNRKTIDRMVQDIATTNRQSPLFPYLRNFDIYESHSWADGFGNFGDGNNQESSSEAINAWYAVYLWSEVTNDQNLQNYALYLYNSEISGAKYYWFDIDNILYTPLYDHAIASLVWGGKVDFATWFSDKTNMKYGIQLLPFTPASLYLGTFSDFKKYNDDYEKSGGNITDSWGDLFIMWNSFYEPDASIQMKNQVKNFEGNNPKSLFLYTIYSHKEKSSFLMKAKKGIIE